MTAGEHAQVNQVYIAMHNASVNSSSPSPIPPPPPPIRANPQALAFFFFNGPPPGSSPSNRRLYSQATLSVKNQDILNDLSSHFTLARSVLKIASFEFATLQCFI